MASDAIPWFDYPRRMWRLRYFCLSLVQKDLRARYRNSMLGIGWSLLRPMAMTAVLCAVFSTVFHTSVAEYIPFLLIGLTTWQFFVECTSVGCNSYFQAAAYMRQAPIPLAVFPLRTVLAAGVHNLIALAVGLVFTGLFRGFPSGVALLYLLPALVLCACLGWALAILCGVANTHFTDIQQLLEIGIQILFYLTPVLYPPESLQDRHHLAFLLRWNPMSHLLAVVRTPILNGVAASMEDYLIAVGFTLLTAGLAWLALRKLERRLVFWI
ncbi:hypothetical protein AYO40_05490 [Planctomycetaceae bacterium SCGC AG-212-D15]|nr:hypothetical protein AYO40_05490 [Planctomycetaceae bacterium SCGC AG-212-D15]